MKIYCSAEDGTLNQIDNFIRGCWVNLVAPTEQELQKVITELKIVPDFLSDPLDSEEKARIESDEGQTLIIVDTPIIYAEDKSVMYETIPLGIIVTSDYVVTICLERNTVIRDFEKSKLKTFFTFKRTRFVFQMLYRIATYYLRYLKQINKQTDKIEEQLHKSLKNQELFALLNIQKSLVYFTTSLKSNEAVLDKLLKGNFLKMYEEDEDILEDVIIENKQAIEMANTYVSIIGGMMDAFASVISNNLNIVMKALTSITIVLAIPTMIASFFGMNVIVPMSQNSYAFLIILGIAVLLSTITGIVFMKKKFF